MVVFVLSLVFTSILAFSQTIFQHFGETGIADFKFLFVLQIHEISFFDGEVPQKFSDLG